MNVSRRSLITGIGCIIAAPAIVRASSLMAIKPPPSVPMAVYGLNALACARFQFEFEVPGTPWKMNGTTWSAKRYCEIEDNYRSIHPDMIITSKIVTTPERRNNKVTVIAQ